MATLWNSAAERSRNYIVPAKMRQWSKEWLGLISREELVSMLKDAKQSLNLVSSMGQAAASLMWEGRLEQIQDELGRRLDTANPEA